MKKEILKFIIHGIIGIGVVVLIVAPPIVLYLIAHRMLSPVSLVHDIVLAIFYAQAQIIWFIVLSEITKEG